MPSLSIILDKLVEVKSPFGGVLAHSSRVPFVQS